MNAEFRRSASSNALGDERHTGMPGLVREVRCVGRVHSKSALEAKNREIANLLSKLLAEREGVFSL